MRFSYQSKGYMARVRIDKRFLIFRKTAQEDVVAEMYHIPDIFSLINIKHTIFPNLLKGLYAQWQSLKLLLSHVFLVFSYLCDGFAAAKFGQNREMNKFLYNLFRTDHHQRTQGKCARISDAPQRNLDQ